MILRSVVRDCLYLNWALPAASLPEPPSPLRYEVHRWQDADLVFASALLFRQERVRLAALPMVRLSYPQFNLRIYVRDGEGMPAVLFWSVLVPFWVAPVARLLARQRTQWGSFRYPRPSRAGGADGEEEWRWTVRRRGRLEVAARPGSPRPGEGPDLGSWERTVAHLRERPRGYARGSGGRLRRVETTHPQVAVWPVRAEIAEDRLLGRCLPLDAGAWPGLHSAWLCPEIPFVFELSEVRERPLPRQVPAAG